jgi:dTDP-4-amino-4,6-dideoxygalactose transaminase
MQAQPRPFDQTIYVTRPILPPLDQYVNRLKDIWESRWLTNGGPQHAELETVLGAVFNTRNLSLFNNGTIALVTACQALRLVGEVITTPFTFPATPHVLSWNNITPVFADIDPVTMNLDPRNIEPLITSRTSAILAVHVYGTPCDVLGIQALADRHGLRVVYDAAHAFGARIGDKSITEFGDASMLSFHATKLFHTAEGGAIITRDPEVKRRIDFLKNFGISDEFTVLMPGINGKMSELQAALGLLVLQMVDNERQKRRLISEVYHERLGGINCLTLPDVPKDTQFSWQYFAIRITGQSPKSRDEIFDGLREFNIHARKYFYPLCSDYSCYRMLPSAHPSYLPIAHKVAAQVMCLPFYGDLSLEDVHRICDVLLFLLAK